MLLLIQVCQNSILLILDLQKNDNKMDDPKHFITRRGLRELDNYAYKSYGYTYIDTKMNIFWEFLANLLPKRLAPNLITFIGFIFIILSYVLMLRYDYTFTKNIPSYCFYAAALFIFLYMNLDAIDGKQARNIHAASPLGQLFDHGCDSFTLTFIVLSFCQATKLASFETFLVFVSCQLGFFTANWMQYHTGTLRTKIGQFGVTQLQFLCIAIHIITGYYGQQIWQTKIGDFVPDNFQLQHLELYKIWLMKIKTVIAYGFTFLICTNLLYVYISTIKKSQNKVKAASQFSSIYIIILMQFLWFNNLSIYVKYGGLILLNFGLLVSLIVCKMIICSVTKMKFQNFHKQLIVFIIVTILMLVAENSNYFNLKYTQNQIKSMTIFLFWFCFIVNLISIFKFVNRVINQLTDYLGIYCFKIDRKQRKKQFHIPNQ